MLLNITSNSRIVSSLELFHYKSFDPILFPREIQSSKSDERRGGGEKGQSFLSNSFNANIFEERKFIQVCLVLQEGKAFEFE